MHIRQPGISINPQRTVYINTWNLGWLYNSSPGGTKLVLTNMGWVDFTHFYTDEHFPSHQQLLQQQQQLFGFHTAKIDKQQKTTYI